MTDTITGATTSSEEQVRRHDRAHVFHSWSAQGLIDPLPIASAEGSHFTDYSGKRYLDFSSQLVNVNIGYQHPKLVAAIQEQAGRLTTISPAFANDARSEAARLITEIAPGDLNMVFFTNGGAEATENALRMARLHTGRHKVMAAYRSYHGATAGAIAMTGDPRRWASEPGMPGVVRYWGPYPYRSAFHAQDEAQESERALQHLRDTITVEGPHDDRGDHPRDGRRHQRHPRAAARLPRGRAGPLRRVRDHDDRRRGHGRVRPLRRVVRRRPLGRHARPHHLRQGRQLRLRPPRRRGHVRPGRGHLLGAALPRRTHLLRPPAGLRLGRRLHQHLPRGGDHRARPRARRGGHRARAARLAEKHPSVGEVRGLGVFWALELVRDRKTREPLVPFNAAGADAAPMNEFAAACKERGLWPFTHFNRTHVVPPCTTTADEVREGIAILDEALAVADRYSTES